MGVDIHAGAFGLLEQRFQIHQIVSGNQDRRVFTHADVHFRNDRMAVGRGIGFVQQRHGFDAVLAGLQDQRHQFVGAETVVQRGCQGFVNKCVDFDIFHARIVGMLGVGGHALEPVDRHFPKGTDVFVFRGEYADGICFFQHGFPGVHGEVCCIVEILR